MSKLQQEELLSAIKEADTGFIQFIYSKLGIVIKQHQTHDLHKTILSAYHKFNYTPREYLNLLQSCQNQSPLLEHLIAGVTIGETYFFRDDHQIKLLKDRILTNIIQKKRQENNLSLRIWSAGSATGEEIYTIVMLLYEAIPDIHNWTLNLLATDINTEALKKAITGQYGEWSMRSIKDNFKERYFTKKNNDYHILPKVRDLVHFDYLNLNDDTYPAIFNGTNAQDLILCRNVFIYFDNNRIAKLMQKFNACLVAGGYMLLGASDPVNISGTDFIYHHHDGLVFTRPTLEEQAFVINKPITVEKPRVTPREHKITAKHHEKIQPKKKVVEYSSNNEITQLLQTGHWQEVLNIINLAQEKEQNNKFMLSAKATALANLGKLAQAEEVCQKSLVHHSTDKETYFTYALILIELNHLVEAETILRKTLFLDHQFVPAHFQLGLLLLRNKQRESGLKSLNNALSIAKSKDEKEEVSGSQGLRYGRLVEILKHEIELHTSAGNIKYADENA